MTPPFLRNQTGYGAVTDYRNWGLTLGRRFRSLKILFMLRSFGVSGFQAHLRRTIALTERLEALVEGDDDFELVTRRSLALLVFRLRPSALRGDAKAAEDLNKRLYANIHKRTSIQLSEWLRSVFRVVVPGGAGADTLAEYSLDRDWRHFLHQICRRQPWHARGAHPRGVVVYPAGSRRGAECGERQRDERVCRCHQRTGVNIQGQKGFCGRFISLVESLG